MRQRVRRRRAGGGGTITTGAAGWRRRSCHSVRAPAVRRRARTVCRQSSRNSRQPPVGASRKAFSGVKTPALTSTWRYRCVDLLSDIRGLVEGPALVARCAQAALLAGEGQEVFVAAVRAAQAGETRVAVAAAEKGGYGGVHLRGQRPPSGGGVCGVRGAKSGPVIVHDLPDRRGPRLARAKMVGAGGDGIDWATATRRRRRNRPGRGAATMARVTPLANGRKPEPCCHAGVALFRPHGFPCVCGRGERALNHPHRWR